MIYHCFLIFYKLSYFQDIREGACTMTAEDTMRDLIIERLKEIKDLELLDLVYKILTT